jgi:hypothetical protein
MSGVDFLGSDVLETAKTLERLANDLRQLACGTLPDRTTLAEAPLLHRWHFVQRPGLALSGSVHGHLNMTDGKTAVTSEVFALDQDRRWARTLSRYYALGAAAIEAMDG